MGNVTAHVIGHSLAIEGHHPDPNNIMYESLPRGTNWDSNDVNAILRCARTLTKSITRGEGSYDFVIFKPENIFKLLLGQPDVTLVTYDLPEFAFGFEYLQEFPVWGPLSVTLRGGFSGGVDLGMGYDTHGLEQFRSFRNPH